MMEIYLEVSGNEIREIITGLKPVIILFFQVRYANTWKSGKE